MEEVVLHPDPGGTDQLGDDRTECHLVGRGRRHVRGHDHCRLGQRRPVQFAVDRQRQAIQRDQQGAFVMVVGADNKVELRRVDVSRSARGQAVIDKGLKEGENVITDGVGKVRPGITVDATPAAGG